MATLREVVVIDAVRSAIGKSGVDGMKKNGQLCQASAQELLASTMRGLLDRVKAQSPKFDEHDIEDVIVGCLSQLGEQGFNIGRVGSLLAGIPDTVSACTVNQFCMQMPGRGHVFQIPACGRPAGADFLPDFFGAQAVRVRRHENRTDFLQGQRVNALGQGGFAGLAVLVGMEQPVDILLTEVLFILQLLPVVPVTFERFFKTGEHNRFEDVIEHPAAHDFLQGLTLFCSGNHDDVGRLLCSANAPEDVRAVAFRKIIVKQEESSVVSQAAPW